MTNKVKQEKISQFIGFHPNTGKIFAAYAKELNNLKKAITELKILWESFAIH